MLFIHDEYECVCENVRLGCCCHLALFNVDVLIGFMILCDVLNVQECLILFFLSPIDVCVGLSCCHCYRCPIWADTTAHTQISACVCRWVSEWGYGWLKVTSDRRGHNLSSLSFFKFNWMGSYSLLPPSLGPLVSIHVFIHRHTLTHLNEITATESFHLQIKTNDEE